MINIFIFLMAMFVSLAAPPPSLAQNNIIPPASGRNDTREEQKAFIKGIQTESGDIPSALAPLESIKDLSPPPSRVENIFKGIIPDVKEDLKQFGYDFFRDMNIVPPDYTLPVGDNYIVGPGDKLVIYLWGDAVDILKRYEESGDTIDPLLALTVDRDGVVFIPKFGALPVWGSTVAEVLKLITKAFRKKFKSFEIRLTVANIRSFPVYMVGEVRRPGTVMVNGVCTIMDALIRAGGINKNGSLRRITVKRNYGNRKETIDIDLYKFLLSGDIIDISMKAGDVIMVPTIGGTAGIAGSVRRPAIYELTANETLEDMISFAGGIIPAGNIKRVLIERYEKNQERRVLHFSPEESAHRSFKIHDGDVVSVYSIYKISENTITLEGAVKNRGVYPLREGLKLSDLIRNKDDILPNAYLHYAEILRIEHRGENPRIIPFSITGLLNKNIDFDLKPMDKIKIFNRWGFQQIIINGELDNPGRFTYIEGFTLSDALGMVKFKEEPKHLKVELSQPGQPIKVIYLNDLLIKGNKGLDIPLAPGARILIKPKEKDELIDVVRLYGECTYPNIYPIKKNMRISDLISAAGGLTENAYLPGVILLRKSVRAAQSQKLKISLLNLEEQLIRESGKTDTGGTQEEQKAIETSLQSKEKMLETMQKKMELTIGRVVVHIDPDFDRFRGSEDDIPLEEGDELYIPPVPSYVLVLGDVYNQVGLTFKADKTILNYVEELGGYKKSADKENMYIIKADGSVISRSQESRTWPVSWDKGYIVFSRSFEDMKLTPGDTIVIPTEIKAPILWRPIIRDVTSIIFQSLTTLAVIKTL